MSVVCRLCRIKKIYTTCVWIEGWPKQIDFLRDPNLSMFHFTRFAWSEGESVCSEEQQLTFLFCVTTTTQRKKANGSICRIISTSNLFLTTRWHDFLTNYQLSSMTTKNKLFSMNSLTNCFPRRIILKRFVILTQKMLFINNTMESYLRLSSSFGKVEPNRLCWRYLTNAWIQTKIFKSQKK